MINPTLLAALIVILICIMAINLVFNVGVLFALFSATIGVLVILGMAATLITPETLPAVGVLLLANAVLTLGIVNYGRHV